MHVSPERLHRLDAYHVLIALALNEHHRWTSLRLPIGPDSNIDSAVRNSLSRRFRLGNVVSNMSGLRQMLVREGRSDHRYNGRRTNPKQYACGFGSARPLQGIEL